jgi:hypothetical protein
MRIWTLLTLAGVIAFLFLFLGDREREASLDRPLNYRLAPHAAIDGSDPDLRWITENSPYMRNERY